MYSERRHRFFFTAHFVKQWLLLLSFVVPASFSFAQQAIITDRSPAYTISANMDELVDKTNALTAEQVVQRKDFVNTQGRIPIYPNDIKNVWFRFSVSNNSGAARLFLNIAFSNLSHVTLYRVDGSKPVLLEEQGNAIPVSNRFAGSPNFVFDLKSPPGTTAQYLLHVNSTHPIIVPARVLTTDGLYADVNLQNIITSLYLGVLAVMFLYNLFLFFATRDNSYIFYVAYIFLLALAQTTFTGYEAKYLWPNNPGLNKYAVVITSILSSAAGLVFSMNFLRTKELAPRVHKWLQLLVLVYLVGLAGCLFSNVSVGYQILNFNGILGVISVLATSFYMARRNFRPAYFYLAAWMFFLITFVILILRNLAVLPYNNFTTYIIYVGSSLEVALLSIALADKINVLRREKEQSQAESLRRLEINQQLVKEQNITLERKVAERTEELQSSNNNLSVALQDLKDTQIQLVEAEKMASLGQLTAGIAHEINNPINFVKSNIKPLELDINDLIEIIDAYDGLHTAPEAEIQGKLAQIDKLKKQIDVSYVRDEIRSLVKGIHEGAERTAEIVKGLRTFSRLDESEVKIVDVHEGIDSTLVILKNAMPANITIKKDFQAHAEIECYPGKLNQVFMNILSNGIQAIKEKTEQGDESITITTRDLGDDKIQISIKDSGMGMTDEVRQKIFDPFFTTKEVGEGTGLGLSIVYKIIQKHEGKIEVVSSRGNGAEFILSLYRKLPPSAFD
ncbi:GHKL domain-containing protein [Sediminibacterium roseum]|uniref:histidine kinase n=1 Tax=Sediminibacterium roseum TaxID=1978412 RepID=A0ABW9ZQY1_9BACT|nr:7TM diverse intracellular signaling domain-containing protein [Sediminibacterium roseum]NCI49510.1 GHKL domain-containing protein [Sediminibacterium roseum]